MVEIAHEQYSKDQSGFKKLFNDVEKPLYEGLDIGVYISEVL